jgi:hypothetical protein
MKIRKEITISDVDFKRLELLAASKKRTIKNYIENLICEHLKNTADDNGQKNTNPNKNDG